MFTSLKKGSKIPTLQVASVPLRRLYTKGYFVAEAPYEDESRQRATHTRQHGPGGAAGAERRADEAAGAIVSAAGTRTYAHCCGHLVHVIFSRLRSGHGARVGSARHVGNDGIHHLTAATRDRVRGVGGRGWGGVRGGDRGGDKDRAANSAVKKNERTSTGCGAPPPPAAPARWPVISEPDCNYVERKKRKGRKRGYVCGPTCCACTMVRFSSVLAYGVGTSCGEGGGRRRGGGGSATTSRVE